MVQSSWEQTRLWEEIRRGSQASAASDRIASRMPLFMADAEATLARGETAPADFTLHDEMHGFRVAERMAELIGISRLREFSTTELALLLASAYLHDIGMTPARGHVRRHREYLITGEAGLLTDEQRNELQKWLDDHADGVTPPLSTGTPDSATLTRVDELLTYYCRSQHNDWSADWIRENVATPDREIYLGFSDDLIQLCQSHHEGYDELIAARFDAKLIGSDIVHPRYLAVLLRIADILEFDPERTPEIIFRHREVAPSSTIYWHKDHEVSFRTEANYFIFYARPRDAATFQALRQMANEIDNELAVCARLEKEGRFQLAPLRVGNDPRYAWRFEPILKRDLHPKPNTFEEFEGAFQPNPRRLLALLAGTQLYDTPMAAVRELLQNAFDAVREQIAYERLAEIERFGTADVDRFASRHFVMLDVRADGDRWELVCTDSGVGMTRDILRRRFLTSGSGRGHREFELERRCRAHGFSVGRTGEFGIGALSYFMIADRVELTTRRSVEPGDVDGAWQFRVSGLNDFGELRHTRANERGTAVRLRLKPEIVQGNIEEFVADMHRYLAYALCRVPCRFVAHDKNGNAFTQIEPGWIKTVRDLASAKFPTLDPTARWQPVERSFLLPSDYSPRTKLPPPFPHRDDVWRRLHWNCEEGDLPHGVGRFRIHLYWFDLDGGASRVWFGSRTGKNLEIRGDELPTGVQGRYVSWNGIAVRDTIPAFHNCSIEVDFESNAAGKVAVNRTTVDFSENAKHALEWVTRRADELESAWLNEQTSSPFWAYALRYSSGTTTTRADSHWAFRTAAEDVYQIRAVKFPAIAGTRRSVQINGVEFESLEPYPDDMAWEFSDVSPHRVIVQRGNHLDLLLVWDGDRKSDPFVAFPPSWHEIVAIETESDVFYSGTNPLAVPIRQDLLSLLQTHGTYNAFDWIRKHDVRADVRLVAALGNWERIDAWQKLSQQERSDLWDSAMRAAARQFSRLIVIDQDNRTLNVHTRDGAKSIPFDDLTRKDLRDLLPDPGSEWQFDHR